MKTIYQVTSGKVQKTIFEFTNWKEATSFVKQELDKGNTVTSIKKMEV